jgi:two-component system CheB/CheR fusion protein
VFAQAAGLKSPEDIVGKTDSDLPWLPEQTASFREYDRRIMESDAPEFHIIERLREADGKLAWVETNKAPLRDAQGRVVGILGTYEDITERKQAEEALQASEAKYRFLVENAKDITWTIDLQGRWTFISSNVGQVTGYRPDEVIGKTVWDFLAPECHDLVRERLGRRGRGEDVPPYEVLVVGKDGRHTPFELHTAPILDNSGHIVGVQGVSRDITERKKVEEALREWNATLESRVAQRTEELEQRARQLQKLTLELTEAEERERKRLAEILHDDLQQVLAAAKFQVGLLSSRVQNDAESQQVAGHVRNLLIDAIAKSRSLSHELSAPVLSQSDLGEAFEWLAQQMQTKHGLTVHLDLGGQTELASEPLRVLLYKAAQEALFNVVKHAGVHEAKLRLRRERGRIRLSVSDRGRGFDPTKPGYTLGFGLLSIRERVGCLGGRIKIRSAVGKGSTFRIAVPDAESPA